MFQCQLVLGWLFAITCGVSTVYGIYTVYRTGGRQFNKAENVIYGTVSRFVWSLALAWVIYVCHRGYGSEFCRSFFIFPWFAVLVLAAFVLILAAVAVLVGFLLAAPVTFVVVLVLAAVAVAVSVVVVVVIVSFRFLCRPYFGVRIYSRSFLHFPSLPSSKALLLFLISLSHSLFAQNPFISLLTPKLAAFHLLLFVSLSCTLVILLFYT